MSNKNHSKRTRPVNRFLEIVQFVILAGFITTGNLSGFHTEIMRPLTALIFFFMIIILYFLKRESGISMVQKGFLLFIILNTMVFWIFPEQLGPVIFSSPTGILYGVLFSVVFFPALFRKSYFTEFFARKTTPEEFWATDIFKTINRNMSLVWAGIFALSAFITYLPYLLPVGHNLITGITFQVILPLLIIIGYGIPFNKKYPVFYMKSIGLDPALIIPQNDEPFVTKNDIKIQNGEKKMNIIKIVAINGSPHGNIGNTSQMIRMIGSAIAEQGVDSDLEEIFLSDKKIEYCIGCGFCLENKRCWQKDDHNELIDALLDADAVILGSPVYFKHVTAQMKTFIDRSLSFGHKLRSATKPGIAVCVSAGMGESETGRYLAGLLRVYGAFSVGTLTAIATSPGGFLGKEQVEARARDLGADLIRAIKEKRVYPATDESYQFYLFMRDLVSREKEFMTGDYKHWEENGILDRFESYAKQEFTQAPYNWETRKEWLKNIIKETKAKNAHNKEKSEPESKPEGVAGIESITSCHELLKMMPLGFKKEDANGLEAVYQFNISGGENFSAYLSIEKGNCVFHEGTHRTPDVTVNSPDDVWLNISKGELDGQTAFMSGKYKVDGNLMLLMKLNSLFGNA